MLGTEKTATTGCAADNIGGVTLHSFIGMNHRGEVNIEPKSSKAWYISKCDVLFIDEVSMLERELLYLLEDVLRQFGNSNVRFGGKSIILLGDPAQLPPIGNHIWQQREFGIFTVLVLRESQRQKDVVFIDILNRMRRGQLTDEDFRLLHQHKISEAEALEMDQLRSLMLFPRNVERDSYNQKVMATLEGDAVAFR